MVGNLYQVDFCNNIWVFYYFEQVRQGGLRHGKTVSGTPTEAAKATSAFFL
jgi:hypothetical protein